MSALAAGKAPKDNASHAPRRAASPETRAPAQAGPGANLRALQRAAGNRAVDNALRSPDEVPDAVRTALQGEGRPLDPATRAHMEARYAHDFGHVRIHADPEAAGSAKAVAAQAYTVGSDVIFGEGRYAPDTTAGKRLLAHELAHVVQQSRGGAAPSLEPGSSLEQAASTAAAQVAQSSGPVAVAGASGVGVTRVADTDFGAVATAKRRIAKAVGELDKLHQKAAQAGGSIRAEDALRADDAIASALARARASNDKALMGAAETLTGRFAAIVEGTPVAKTTSLFELRRPGATSAGATGNAIRPYRDAPDIFGELNEELGLTTTSKPSATDRGATGAARVAQREGLMKGWRPAQREGLMKGRRPGVDLAVQAYSAAERVKRALGLTPRQYEALHLAPKAAFEGMPGYDYKEALTFNAPKDLNTILDKPWKASLQELSRKGQKPTVGQVYDMVAKSIHSDDFGAALKKHGIEDVPGMQGAMGDALRRDVFQTAGLDPKAPIAKTPYANLWGKAGKVGAGGLAVLGGALEYHQLRQSGHGRAESAAQAVGGGIGSLATPGGKAGLRLGLGAAGLGALGAPKPVTTSLQTAGEVMNFTGSALGQTARAGVNLVQGDMKAFDRQMKEMEKGEAGMPLEGLTRWVGMEADTASIVIPQVKAVAQGQKGAKQAWGEAKDNLESMVLKQKFGEKEAGLWGVTAGPMMLREIKLAEALARGKSLREAAKESQQIEKNALTSRAADWASEQGDRFVKKDVPRAVEFAKEKLQDTKKNLGRYWPF